MIGEYRLTENDVRNARKFDDGLVVECNRIQVPSAGADAALGQAVTDGINREAGVVFLPREPFFLCRREDLPVLKDAGSAVMIKGGNAKDLHR